MGYNTKFSGCVNISPRLDINDLVLPKPETVKCGSMGQSYNGFAIRESRIIWDQLEKFYNPQHWMVEYVNCLAPKGYVLNGRFKATGEESFDRWVLVVINNIVFRISGDHLYIKKNILGDYTVWCDRDRVLTADESAFHHYLMSNRAGRPVFTEELIEEKYQFVNDEVLARMVYLFTENQTAKDFLKKKFGKKIESKKHFIELIWESL